MDKKILPLLVLVVILVAPFAGVYPLFVLKVLCFALFACAFNLLIGYAGLLSFGHAALFGGAGYIAGHALKHWGITPELALLVGTLTGALLGAGMGALAIRRQGIYFSMITLALAQMLYFACLQAPFTGGEDGLQGVPRGNLFGLLSLEDDRVLYYVVVAIVAAAFVLLGRIVASPFGSVLAAIKEHEPRAVSLGYDADRFKLLAFVLSAAISGLAGSLKVLVLGFETLTDVHWSMSGTVILMALLGGIGTRWGPVLGALVIVTLETRIGDIGASLASLTGIPAFNALGESVTIVSGLLFVGTVMFLRGGLICALAPIARTKRAMQLRRVAARDKMQET
ncbi:branched-chain amino acid ABC transporter permease [Cupriavidus pauculus]|uniref:Branched-chain amino acid ABC transporter permease n=1 Tax=Cupriavidus pauculus TaxID=82633 RepID=A0A5P2H7Y2_9BURK|nr:branched-chain amino acid ABC transporter permease [Cupriavidus pauculus]QET04267.1 branched-chain amino acid ABC transporter permease [Cupriavidus pauculus]